MPNGISFNGIQSYSTSNLKDLQMEIVVFAIATFFNFWILSEKLKRSRYLDTFIDFMTMVILGYLFSGTMAGMAIAMLTGVLISIYLWFRPYKIADETIASIKKTFYFTMSISFILAIIFTVSSKLMH